MRRLLMIALAACLLLAPFDSATAGSNRSGWGFGIMVGEPTGLSAKNWSGGGTAWDFGLAWSTADDSGAAAHVDYLRHRFGVSGWDGGDVAFYYGIGGRIRSRDPGDDNVGVRVPLGLDYLFDASPVDVFVELVPIMDLVPDTDFNLGLGIGVRYFF